MKKEDKAVAEAKRLLQEKRTRDAFNVLVNRIDELNTLMEFHTEGRTRRFRVRPRSCCALTFSILVLIIAGTLAVWLTWPEAEDGESDRIEQTDETSPAPTEPAESDMEPTEPVPADPELVANVSDALQDQIDSERINLVEVSGDIISVDYHLGLEGDAAERFEQEAESSLGALTCALKEAGFIEYTYAFLVDPNALGEADAAATNRTQIKAELSPTTVDGLDCENLDSLNLPETADVYTIVPQVDPLP